MNLRRIGLFCVLAFVPAWALGFGYFALGGSLRSPWFVLMAVGYMATPAFAAYVVQRFVVRRPLAEIGLAKPAWRWVFGAGPLAFGLVWAALLLSLLVPGVWLSLRLEWLGNLEAHMPADQVAMMRAHLESSPLARPGMVLVLTAVQALVAGATINAVVALGEELGWRGFLDAELASLGFWRAAAVTGIIWGVWHWPLIAQGYNYPGHPVLGPLMMVGLCVLLSPLLSFVRVRSRSVFGPAVFHGTFNATAGLAIFLIGGGPYLTGMTGATGFAALVAANLMLVWVRRRAERRAG